jgi:site-specific recombinase XerD
MTLTTRNQYMIRQKAEALTDGEARRLLEKPNQDTPDRIRDYAMLECNYVLES